MDFNEYIKLQEQGLPTPEWDAAWEEARRILEPALRKFGAIMSKMMAPGTISRDLYEFSKRSNAEDARMDAALTYTHAAINGLLKDKVPSPSQFAGFLDGGVRLMPSSPRGWFAWSCYVREYQGRPHSPHSNMRASATAGRTIAGKESAISVLVLAERASHAVCGNGVGCRLLQEY